MASVLLPFNEIPMRATVSGLYIIMLHVHFYAKSQVPKHIIIIIVTYMFMYSYMRMYMYDYMYIWGKVMLMWCVLAGHNYISYHWLCGIDLEASLIQPNVQRFGIVCKSMHVSFPGIV